MLRLRTHVGGSYISRSTGVNVRLQYYYVIFSNQREIDAMHRLAYEDMSNRYVISNAHLEGLAGRVLLDLKKTSEGTPFEILSFIINN